MMNPMPCTTRCRTLSARWLNLKELNLLIDVRQNDDKEIFEHLHHSTGKRNIDLADQHYYSKWKDDELTWNKRRTMTLEERLS